MTETDYFDNRLVSLSVVSLSGIHCVSSVFLCNELQVKIPQTKRNNLSKQEFIRILLCVQSRQKHKRRVLNILSFPFYLRRDVFIVLVLQEGTITSDIRAI